MTTCVDEAAWKEHAQTFECEYWSTAHERKWGCGVDPGDITRVHQRFVEVSRAIWVNFGVTDFDGVGLDIGPGPLGRCSALGGTWDAIEPLGTEYRKIPWAFLPYRCVFPVPAEVSIPALFGLYDFVVSLNCIDHCYNAGKVLVNIAAYMKPEACAFVSFDVDKECESDPTHPLNMTASEADGVIVSSGFRIIERTSGRCYPNPDGTWRDNWGGGTAYHWLLRK